MENKNEFYNSFSVILILIFIAPFIYITRFAHLSADDFCRAPAELGEYFKDISEWYLHHNGRFTNALLSFLPVYDSQIYRLVLAFSMILLGVAIFFFVQKVFQFFNLMVGFPEIFFVSVVFYVGLINRLPSLYEFFYWYAGTTAYMYSNILLLFLLGLLLRNPRENKRKLLLTGLIVVLINGNNEMLIPLINLLLLVFLVKTSIGEKKKLSYDVLFLNVLSWISSLVVIFSPGSTNRQSFYPDGGDFIFSVKSAVLSSGMFTIKNLLQFPQIILCIGLFVFFLHLSGKVPKKTLSINPILLAVISLLGLVSVFFIPFYATGHLNVNQGRIGNMIQVIFWIILFMNLVNITLYTKQKFFRKVFVPAYLPQGIMTIFFIFTGFSNKNFGDLLSDFRNDEFGKFERAMDKREAKIKEAEGSRLEVQKIVGSKIIKHYGISTDENHWTNECYTTAVNSSYNKEFVIILAE